ncbi:T9SS type A sorting domain-containing protein [Fulvivirga ligni]|uniref:T9SS type A sorting domain-containing protein n=1 Tax=Fulvivirga ligni TaxID=2904246 RepID=UPI001F171AE0|nr:T9SS type A sorting domain-containing protein [Fulvivirga ligni]UII21113.1 T9SS type A sorting domain-containing protein [Fulvivirga ligni]
MKTYTVLFLMIISIFAYGQDGYYSNNNYQGTWLNDASWNKSQTWMGNNPGPNVGGAAAYVDVYGIITREGNLTLGGSSAVTIYDTLWVNGDLIVGGGSSLTVDDNGLLIIEGDLRTEGGTVTVNDGRIIAKSNLRSVGGSSVENSGSGSNAFYVFGGVSRNGGAEFNGSRNAEDGYFLTESDLYNDDPALYNYVMTGTLPVEFLYVDAKITNGVAMITWATGSELNNDFFTLERSTDGINFQEIATVDGAGNSSDVIEYSVEDFSAANGANYYRVKQTDFDGQYEYSKVVNVFNEAVRALEVTAFPNPATDQLNVRIDGFGSDEVTVELTDDRGMAVYTNTFDSSFENVAQINVSNLPSGLYIVTLKTSIYNLTTRVLVK